MREGADLFLEASEVEGVAGLDCAEEAGVGAEEVSGGLGEGWGRGFGEAFERKHRVMVHDGFRRG